LRLSRASRTHVSAIPYDKKVDFIMTDAVRASPCEIDTIKWQAGTKG